MNGMQEAIRLCNAADEILRAVRAGDDPPQIVVVRDDDDRGPRLFTASELDAGMKLLLRLGVLVPQDFGQGEDGA